MTTPTTTESTTQDSTFSFEIGSPLFYLVIGAGSMMSVLVFVILMLCVAIGCLALKRRLTYVFTTQPPPATQQLNQNEEGQISDQQLQVQSRKMNYNSKPVIITPQVSPDCVTIINERSNLQEESLQQPPQNLFYESIDNESIDNFRQTSDGKEKSSLGVSILSAKCVKNPAYIHLGPEEEGHQDSPRVSPSKCVKNPAYIHLPPEEDIEDLVILSRANISASHSGHITHAQSISDVNYHNVPMDINSDECSNTETVIS